MWTAWVWGRVTDRKGRKGVAPSSPALPAGKGPPNPIVQGLASYSIAQRPTPTTLSGTDRGLSTGGPWPARHAHPNRGCLRASPRRTPARDLPTPGLSAPDSRPGPPCAWPPHAGVHTPDSRPGPPHASPPHTEPPKSKLPSTDLPKPDFPTPRTGRPTGGPERPSRVPLTPPLVPAPDPPPSASLLPWSGVQPTPRPALGRTRPAASPSCPSCSLPPCRRERPPRPGPPREPRAARGRYMLAPAPRPPPLLRR